MKAGDVVKLMGIPPNLKDQEDLPTRTLFEKCLGQLFVVAGVDSVNGVPTPLAKLDVGQVVGVEPWKHTISVEPEYLQFIDPYRVVIVLDREYGERLSQLVGQTPVWIIATPTNRAEAQKIWAADSDRNHLDGVTTFKTKDDRSPEEALINELDAIDDHQGIYSANPPYTVIEVIGTSISDRLKGKLSQFGFDRFEATPQGFRAIRPLPSDWSPDRWRKILAPYKSLQELPQELSFRNSQSWF
jgi:hypothetical protein